MELKRSFRENPENTWKAPNCRLRILKTLQLISASLREVVQAEPPMTVCPGWPWHRRLAAVRQMSRQKSESSTLRTAKRKHQVSREDVGFVDRRTSGAVSHSERQACDYSSGCRGGKMATKRHSILKDHRRYGFAIKEPLHQPATAAKKRWSSLPMR